MTVSDPLRHPEKAHRPDQPSPPKPDWIRVRAPVSAEAVEISRLMRSQHLHTVCEEAACPNVGECWGRRHAAFLILGDICTRACAFCNVRTGRPGAVDPGEPARLAETVAAMSLHHVVITSVDRDDLADGGASQFVACIAAIRAASPDCTIEVLTPDFRDKGEAPLAVIAAGPDLFNHNIETVPRLYPSIRPGARYFTSLRLLQRVSETDPRIITKSGLMVGLGESREEVLQVMDDLRAAGVSALTLGQYLQPSPKHAPIRAYLPPEAFADYAAQARAKGFAMVAATPLTRSSHHADRDFEALRAARRGEGL